jgi:Family of unknown function (DUF6194)
VDETQIHRYIIDTYPDTDVVTAGGGTFFSIDPEKHWPNFATLVTTDEFDEGAIANLSRPGVFRLNIGVTGKTFDRVLGDAARNGTPVDYAALDTLLPHPVYAKQHWLSVLNPSDETFDRVVKPLLDEAYGILARRKAQALEAQARKA